MRQLIIMLFFPMQSIFLNAQTRKFKIINIENEKGEHLYIYFLFNNVNGYPKNEVALKKIFLEIDYDRNKIIKIKEFS